MEIDLTVEIFLIYLSIIPVWKFRKSVVRLCLIPERRGCDIILKLEIPVESITPIRPSPS
jgi:hypothetical protein